MRHRILASLLVAAAVAFLAARPVEAGTTRDLYAAEAYGSYSFVGQTATSGKSAFVVLGCQAKPGTVVQNTAQSSEQSPPDAPSPSPAPTPTPAPTTTPAPDQPDPGTTRTGSVNTSVSAIKNSSITKTLSSALTNGVNMLKGRITASRAKAVSATFKDANGIHTSSAGSTLSDLVVDGDRFEVSPGPNTTVTLPKLGYAVFNEQFSNTSGTLPSMVVNMIHVYVTEQNPMGLQVGTQMIVSRGYSALKPNIAGILGGSAFGSRLFDGSRAQSGPSAVVYMPCLGTNGVEVQNPALDVGQPSVFDVGTMADTAKGTVNSLSANGELVAADQAVNLLYGLITAGLFRADAHASRKGGVLSFSDAGSRFENLVVAGQSIASTVAPNTQIPLPGIGTLWLHRVFRNPNNIDIRMIEVVVQQDNPFGLTPGSKLQLAVAIAVAAP